MKLIIDIPDKVKAEIDANYTNARIEMIAEEVIQNGIPLEQIRAEIDEIPLSEPMVSADGLYCYGSKSITMGHFREKVFEIIDKYRKGANE